MIIRSPSRISASISGNRRVIAIASFIKLVAFPLFWVLAAAALGFRGIEFATLISIFATPCAVAGFVMAQQMDSDADLAGNCVVFTSALSCFTIFCWIVLFKEMGAL